MCSESDVFWYQSQTVTPMFTRLRVLSVPTSLLSAQDVCVSRMSAGSQLFHRLLGVLSDRLEGLNDLRADVRDLLTHINKVTHPAI